MKRLISTLATLLCTILGSCILAGGASSAQDTASSFVLDACLPGKAEIHAVELPKSAGETLESKVVNLEDCPVGGRPIVDHGAGATLPPRGEGVHNEVLTTTGAQELKIEHHTDGTIIVEHVGDEADHSLSGETQYEPEPSPFYRPPWDKVGTTSPGQCADDGLPEDKDQRLESNLQWYFNRSTTPDYGTYDLTPDAAEAEIRQAGVNVATARNSCGYTDVVPVGLSYEGSTTAPTDVTLNGVCDGSLDGKSVVAFGSLSNLTLAAECTGFVVKDFADDPIVESDIKINRSDYRWTNAAPSTCKDRTPGRYNLEALMTHERGHTFGLGHTEGTENQHRWMTMSPNINGPCQNSEVTLGKGDVEGLVRTYEGFGGPAVR